MNSTVSIEKVESGRILTRFEAEEFMQELLSGRMPTAEIARMLLALNQRPIDVSELAGFAGVMRQHAAPVFTGDGDSPRNLVDTCGTGGDGSETFNISTAAAIVASAAGAKVAKHGNRSITSRSGSADVLEALGVSLEVPLTRMGQAIREIGLGFLFAPSAHAATRHAIPARKQISGRTVFNLLGPLTNPAGAEAQVLGVYSADLIDLVAATLVQLGVQRAFVIHGAGGLDEISLSGESQIAEVCGNSFARLTVTPELFGVKRAPIEDLRGGSPQENAAIILRIFQGETGPRLDVVVVNAAAALVLAGLANDFRTAAQLARRAIQSGAAAQKLEQLKSVGHTPKV
jgi:anthranilate phosphoribosyltransferase